MNGCVLLIVCALVGAIAVAVGLLYIISIADYDIDDDGE